MELLLVSGVGRRAVARKFNVSADAVWRHGKSHISDEQRAQMLGGPVKLRELATKASEEGLSLLEYVGMLRSTALSRYFAACEAGDDQTANIVLGRLTDLLRLQGQFSGELTRATSTVTNNTLILSSPLMADLQQMLVTRLRPYPEAARAVMEGLEELSNRALGQVPSQVQSPASHSGRLIEASND